MIEGEIRRGTEIGRGYKNLYIATCCVDCGKLKWTQLGRHKRGKDKRCRVCGNRLPRNVRKGENHPCWRGGRIRDGDAGYVGIKLDSTDPFYSMVTNRGYVKEHRLIMARHIGRPLYSFETVHHKNGVTDDNRLENLQLVSRAVHSAYSEMCSKCGLRREIQALRREIKELRKQLQHKLEEATWPNTPFTTIY